MTPSGRFLDIQTCTYGRFRSLIMLLLSACVVLMVLLRGRQVLRDVLRVAEKLVLVVKECVASDLIVMEHFRAH